MLRNGLKSAALTTKFRRVVAIPYPGRGHINPMLNFCNLLASRVPDIKITVILTEEWLGLIRGDAAAEEENSANNICFVTIPNVLPSEQARGADHVGFMEAVLTKIEGRIDKVLDAIQVDEPVKAIVADSFVPWAVGVGRRRNIPVASFWPASVTVYTVFYHHHSLVSRNQYPIDLSGGGEDRIDYIPGIDSIRLADLPNAFHANRQRFLKVVQEVVSTAPRAQCIIFRSIYELESPATDVLTSILPNPIYLTGPAIPYSKISSIPTSTIDSSTKPSYIRWLDSQLKSSVLYVSLGSYLSTSAAQMDELAAGLRDSGVPFLWVARDEALKLKAGCGEKEMIVPWCDQMQVLAHQAVGGFLTHCGWNSTLESAFAGIPLLTFPVSADQPVNSKVIVENWRMGWRLEGEEGAAGLVKRAEIERIVRKFMDLENNERKELESRAKHIQEKFKQAVEEDGASESNLNGFLSDFLPS
ncbi:hypothetical protein Ancab_022068 [Ancistrocladus abbreviatus]